MKETQRGLFWFRHDLRLTDMPALDTLNCRVDELLLVYVFDERMLKNNSFGMNGVGPHRMQFIHECLSELNQALKDRGQHLRVFVGEPVQILSELVNQYQITHVSSHFHGGYYEMNDWQQLERCQPGVTFNQSDASSLFNRCKLPFLLRGMPGQFTPFRKQIERDIVPEAPDGLIGSLSPPVTKEPGIGISSSPAKGLFRGGESAGQQRVIDFFFNSHGVVTYKETRNALDDADASTRFSPWLATGALSPRWVYQQLKRFEAEHVANNSTYWVYFELLWREFFYWAQIKHGANWFQQAGLRGEIRACHHDEEKIYRWQNGETGFPIVDACMRQLKASGFMSNRGRQLVASCFVHELEQNWQFGAAWFEHMLVDYDVGSNWGNWLYLAGVGHDPKGHRQFDLEKQTERYDPEREFIRKWL